jgi:hypothetical protein
MESNELIVVLYDPVQNKLLGRGATWVSLSAFGENPPQSQQDVTPSGGTTIQVASALTGRYVCINGLLYFCMGTSCRLVPDPNGNPIPCSSSAAV